MRVKKDGHYKTVTQPQFEKMYKNLGYKIVAEKKDYSEMKRQGLMQELKEKEIQFNVSMKNDELVELLQNA